MSTKFLNERQLHDWLRKNLGGDWQRIETVTSPGVPDTNFCVAPDGDAEEGWLELKVSGVKNLKPESWVTVDIRPEQVAWITRRARAGGRVGVVIGTADGHIMVVPPKSVIVLLNPFQAMNFKYWKAEAKLKTVTAICEAISECVL